MLFRSSGHLGSGKQEGGKVSEPSELVTKEYRWMTAGVEYVERSKSMSEIGEAEKRDGEEEL